MTARFILARHGNTFTADQTPVWVGARTDLPLVEKGLGQARAIGEALKKLNISLAHVSCGALRRTKETARIAADIAGYKGEIKTDARLTEIDYGAWEGKSTHEIEAMGGAAELAAWSKASAFPVAPGWSPAEKQIEANVKGVLDDAGNGVSLIVSSNGILRFFARFALNATAFPDRKVATGALCVMERGADGWTIKHWNQPPHYFQERTE